MEKNNIKQWFNSFAELRGDEHGSYLADRQGNAYMPNANGTYDVTTPGEALAEIKSFSENMNNLVKTNGLNKAPERRLELRQTNLFSKRNEKRNRDIGSIPRLQV